MDNMRILLIVMAILIALVMTFSNQVLADRFLMTDEEIIQTIIYQSIASYPGTSVPPYYRFNNGSRCGNQGAYSKISGCYTICLKRDVTREIIDKFRGRGR